MKIPQPFTIADCRLPIGEPSTPRAAAIFNRQSQIKNRKSERGMALVITLIMLAVTLVMAVAFLALARRERAAVSTTTDTTTARFATDAALNAAQAQIMANVLNLQSAHTASNGLYNFNLIVSTNYIRANGYDDALGADPVNVNYSYSDNPGRLALTPTEFIQNIANLQFLPRAPVFIVTNTQTGAADFRYYLDLNRNGQFEDSGLVPNLVFDGGTLVTNNFFTAAGDPQWIGMLARPDTTHSPNNQFVSRYAFFAAPIGNALDLNAIYNQSKRLGATSDGYYRNQGVGSWELNLAAFLVDLNTNQWGFTGAYNYSQDSGTISSGAAFDDALSLLLYRYSTNTLPSSATGNYIALANVNSSFANLGNYPFRIDGYADGPLQTTLNNNAAFPADNLNLPWSGANNPNRYTDLSSELFDPNKTSALFTNRLTAPGQNADTYDRYTYYRLLSQLGTDSDPDAGKMNLNYSNVLVNYDNNGLVTGLTVIPGAETNLVSWTATNFFMAAADRMLRLYTTNWFIASPSNYLATYYGINTTYRYLNINGDFVTNDPTGFGLTNLNFGGVAGDGFFTLTNQIPAFGITNIPVYVNGQFVYSPAVNRVLQMAANIYDASTTNFYPSVFKPMFERDPFGDVFIVGFRQVSRVANTSDSQLSSPYDVVNLPASPSYSLIKDRVTGDFANIYGVPWIIGAKKNLPGFNQFSLINSAEVDRLLQVSREFVGGPIWTNHMYLMTITNSLGASFWNSYTNNYPTNYPGSLNLIASISDTVQLVLTNSDHPGNSSSVTFSTNFTFTPSVWPGTKWSTYGSGIPNAGSFIATNWANLALPMEVYKTGAGQFVPLTDSDPWETNNRSCDPLPQLGLITTNWVQAYILDNGHVVDYVQIRGPIDNTNLTSTLADPSITTIPGNYLWATNIDGTGTTPSWGIVNQIGISAGQGTPPASARWNNPTTPSIPNMDTVQAAKQYFATMLTPGSPLYTYNNNTYSNEQLTVQAGYTATRTVFVPYLYQVNDPLVHYLSSDLNAGQAAQWSNNVPMANGAWNQNNGIVSQPIPLAPGYGDIPKSRYQPWGKAAPTTLQSSAYNFSNPYNLMYKDPLVWDSDFWDFPTNVYPTVGWLGRVHRGTPWQTVYLKAHNILAGNAIGTNTWAAWTGNSSQYDAANSAPLQDRLLFDLFTTRFNDNATLGTLSVNAGASSSDPASGLAAWSALFSGMVVITNSAFLSPSINLSTAPLAPVYSSMFISPAGVSSLNSPLGNLVTNIYNARTNFVNTDGVKGSFEHAGDVLSALALTEQSPFLNWTNRVNPNIQNQQKIGIGDEAYEWLPQQMMGLVRVDHAPRYVVYSYGQALRPAPGGLVTAGANNFGLVTNYQVVAESAVRAIVSVQQQVTNSATGPVTNYTTKVESYSVLPPN